MLMLRAKFHLLIFAQKYAVDRETRAIEEISARSFVV